MARIPKTVQKNAEAAEALIAQQAEANKPRPDVTPGQDSKPEAESPEPEVTQDPIPENANDAQSEPDQKPSEQPAAQQQEHDWQKRFIGYKTKMDQEVHLLRQQLNTSSKLLEDAKKQLDANKPDPFHGAVTDDDLSKIDPDATDVVKKLISSAVNRATAPLQARLDAFESGQKKAQEETARGQVEEAKLDFHSRMLAKKKNYQQIDDNLQFQSWLQDIDQDTGRIRINLYLSAAERGDVVRVAELQSQWEKETAKPTNPLENKVEPSTMRGREQSTAQPKTYTQADVEKFYYDKKLGKYKGREDEAKRIEVDIFAAQNEGRILRRR